MGGTSWLAFGMVGNGCVRDTVMQMAILLQLAQFALNSLQRTEQEL